MKNKRTIIIVLLLVALPVLIYLAQTTQIFKPKAAGEGSTMGFFGTGVTDNGSSATTASQNIGVRLTWGAGSGGGGGSNPTPTPGTGGGGGNGGGTGGPTACSTGTNADGCTICGPVSNLVQGQTYQYTISPTMNCSNGINLGQANSCASYVGRLPVYNSSAANSLTFVADAEGENELRFDHMKYAADSLMDTCKLKVQVSSSTLAGDSCSSLPQSVVDLNGDGQVTQGFCFGQPATDSALLQSCALFRFNSGWSFSNPPTGMSSSMIEGCRRLNLNHNDYLEIYEYNCGTSKLQGAGAPSC